MDYTQKETEVFKHSKKLKEIIEQSNGKIDSTLIMNICLYDSFNLKQEIFEIIDVLLEYYPDKIEMSSEIDLNYQLNKGIYNDIYLYYALDRVKKI